MNKRWSFRLQRLYYTKGPLSQIHRKSTRFTATYEWSDICIATLYIFNYNI